MTTCGGGTSGSGNGGHREMCRQLRKKKKKKKQNNALVELMQHVQTLDSHEAYRRMCLVQDEIQRLKSVELGECEMPHHNQPQQQQQQHELNHTDKTMQNEDNSVVTNGVGEAKSSISTTECNSDKLRIKEPNLTEADHVTDNKTSPPVRTSYRQRVSGTWLQNGGKISIEYLPNVKCYRVVLLKSPPTSTEDGVDIFSLYGFPKSQHDLHCTITPQNIQDDGLHDHLEMKLHQRQLQTFASSDSSLTTSALDREEGQILLLSMSLPTLRHSSLHKEGDESSILPNVNISLDANSISLRVQLHQNYDQSTAMTNTESENLVDNLLGVDTSSSSFSPNVVTNALDLNYLRCRSCQHRLLRDISTTTNNIVVTNDDATCQNDNPHSATPAPTATTSIIQSVLPLPSGYWDEISDYLMCYDGQASVDFTSSSTSAIATMALEDDAILVLHKQDLVEAGGVCVLDALGGGYGEHTMEGYRKDGKANGANTGSEDGGYGGAPFRVWKDKAAINGMKSKAATCANCYSTLGYVSEHDTDTFRLYKHLLDCGKENDDDGRNDCGGAVPMIGGSIFTKHTCASFLARELVRYAESDAIYTFIVAISDVNDWTRMGRNNPGACILLRTLGWDTPISTVEGRTRSDGPAEEESSGDLCNYPLTFQKVVKVIFEVVTDRNILTSPQTSNGDNPIEWTWGGTDFCCPPPRLSSASIADGLMNDEKVVQTRASSVGIFLSEREWCELKNELHRSSDYFTEAVSDAFVITKLGLLQAAKLSFLPLVAY
ncbi:hypothetical protein ACHAWU_009382 [Discostella pseudostelligera]|uniref:Uncharacterized protein n=1 Tax=Discostella pseudostelligera TaxID=259834 RepID=A0ABD3LWE7_9STRA